MSSDARRKHGRRHAGRRRRGTGLTLLGAAAALALAAGASQAAPATWAGLAATPYRDPAAHWPAVLPLAGDAALPGAAGTIGSGSWMQEPAVGGGTMTDAAAGANAASSAAGPAPAGGMAGGTGTLTGVVATMSESATYAMFLAGLLLIGLHRIRFYNDSRPE